MDAFYASIEQREHPELVGKAVIIGGDPHERGVVCTCSYEARKYGVHSAMPVSQAHKLCPQGIFVRPNFPLYQAVSNQIRDIFYRYTDLVEPLSLDEAYLDVTDNKIGLPFATKIAKLIKADILRETQLTASAGVSFNKFLAKTASDWNKPNGLTVILPEQAASFIEQLPIGKFHGVGKVTEKKMHDRGIYSGADLRKYEKAALLELFGKSGQFYYKIAHCQDDRPVDPCRERKSYGREVTFQEDINDLHEMQDILQGLAHEVSLMLQEQHLFARTLTLKVRYDDFITVTRRATKHESFFDEETIVKEALLLLQKTDAQKRNVRLLGLAASNLMQDGASPWKKSQGLLF